jgi:hypothetical protein
VSLGITLFLLGAGRSGRNDAWDEARSVLAAAREQIRAPSRASGHGLPSDAEAILVYLEGERDRAVAFLRESRTVPPTTWWVARVLEAMTGASPDSAPH